MDLSEFGRLAVPRPVAVWSPHPLMPARERVLVHAEFLPGETLAEYLERTGIAAQLAHRPVLCTINGRRVPRELWAHVRPKPGTLINVQALVHGGGGGGGKNPIATVLSIALMVAAPGLGAAFGSSLGLTGTAFSVFGQAVTWGSVFGGAISIVGGVALNALFPPPRPQLSQAGFGSQNESPTYALSGGSNRARPWEPLPRVMGRHRMFPDLAAREYTEFEGDDQYLYQCFNFGYGDLLITDYRIGNTPLDSFESVELERAGADGKLKLFPMIVDSIAGGALEEPVVIQRTSSAASTGLAVEITGSLVQFTAEGAPANLSVDLKIEYRAVGASDWLPFAYGTATGEHAFYWSAGYEAAFVGSGIWVQEDFGGTDPNEHYEGEVYSGAVYWHYRPYSEIEDTGEGAPPQGYSVPTQIVAITNGSTKPVRRTFKVNVPAGQYEVRVERLSAAGIGANGQSGLVWSQLRSYRPDTTSYLGQNRLALKIKATGQLSGRIEQFSAIVSARTPAWDGTYWIQSETSNPAWWVLAGLRGAFDAADRRIFGAGLDDARIDIEALKDFGAWCDSKSLTFDGVFDQPISVMEMLSSVALCGRGTVSTATGKHGVVWDAPAQPVVAVFSMSNIERGSFEIAYVTENLADEIEVGFINQDLGWQRDSVRAVVPGVATPVQTRKIELFGCAYKDMAGRTANLYAATNKYRTRRYKWKSDFEGMLAARGDVVQLSHDLASMDYSGRFIEGGNTTTLKLEREVPLAGGGSWILIVKPDGTFATYAVAGGAGNTSTLTLTVPLGFNPWADANHPPYDYKWLYGPTATPGRKVKIDLIRPLDERRVEITAVDEDANYYAEEDSAYTYVPPTQMFGTDAPTISNLEVSEELVRAGSGFVVRLTFTWDVAGRYDHGTVRFAAGGAQLQEVAQTPARRYTVDVSDRVAVSIEVTAVHPLGFVAQSGAKAAMDYQVLGSAASPPEDVPWFSINGMELAWGAVPDVDLAGYRIRYMPEINFSWGNAVPLHTGLLTSPPFVTSIVTGGQVTLMIKAVDTSGNESENVAYIVTDLGDALVANIVETIDLDALGYPGEIVQGAVVSGDLKANDASDLMWNEDASAAMWGYDSALMWGGQNYYAMYYITQITPSQAGVGSRMTLAHTIVADNYAIEYRRNGPQPMWSAVDTELMWSDDAALQWTAPPGDFPANMWTGDANLMWAADSSKPMWTVLEGGYQTWPGEVLVVNEPYDIRVTTGFGPARGVVSELTFTVDLPDKVESLNDVVISSNGTRLPITQTYREISNVSITIQSDGNNAIGERVFDKNPTLGPLVSVYDAGGTAVAGLIDATIQGY